MHTTAGRLADLHRRNDEAVHAGSARAVDKQHAKGKMTARERIDALLDDGLVRRDGRARAAPVDRLRAGGGASVRRRRRHRLRDDRRPPGLRVRPGLHRLRRVARRGVRREDRQGHGPGAQDRPAAHRHQRLRRRAHPGGRGLARPLRRDLLPQRDGVRRRAADLPDHGPVRRRRRLLPGDHRLHGDGRRHLPHVHHRPRRHQDGDRRGRRDGGPRRRPHPQHEVRRRPLPRPRRDRRHRLRQGAAVLPAEQQPRGPARLRRRGRRRARSRSPTRTASSTRSSPTRPTSPTTCTP